MAKNHTTSQYEPYYTEVEAEVERQIWKWGVQKHQPLKWAAIILEELGEAAQAILEDDPQQYRREIIQVAACCISALAAYDLNLNEVEDNGQ